MKSHLPLLSTDLMTFPTTVFLNCSKGMFKHLGFAISTSAIRLPTVSFAICRLRTVNSGSSIDNASFDDSYDLGYFFFTFSIIAIYGLPESMNHLIVHPVSLSISSISFLELCSRSNHFVTKLWNLIRILHCPGSFPLLLFKA